MHIVKSLEVNFWKRDITFARNYLFLSYLPATLRNSFKYLRDEKKAGQRRNFCFAPWLVTEMQLSLGISPSSEIPVLTERSGSQEPPAVWLPQAY